MEEKIILDENFGICFEVFKARLELVQKDFDLIDENVEKMVDGNPFVCDGRGVPSDWLINVVSHSFENLFLAVNPNLEIKEIQDLIDYYVWENNFGGKIDDYDLSKPSCLYDYVKVGL